MKNMTVIKYIMQTVELGYIDSINFNSINQSSISLTVLVSHIEKIKPVMMMIEANMYVRKDILAKSVIYGNDTLTIETFNNITYVIFVKVKEDTKNKRWSH